MGREGSPAGQQIESLVSGDELAERLGCSQQHVDRLRKRGLPHIQVGHLVRYRYTAVLEWLERTGGAGAAS